MSMKYSLALASSNVFVVGSALITTLGERERKRGEEGREGGMGQEKVKQATTGDRKNSFPLKAPSPPPPPVGHLLIASFNDYVRTILKNYLSNNYIRILYGIYMYVLAYLLLIFINCTWGKISQFISRS